MHARAELVLGRGPVAREQQGAVVHGPWVVCTICLMFRSVPSHPTLENAIADSAMCGVERTDTILCKGEAQTVPTMSPISGVAGA